MLCHLFSVINKIFQPNNPKEKHHKDTISINNIRQEDVDWSTYKVILGWYLNTKNHLLTLTPQRVETKYLYLDNINPHAPITTIKRCSHLLGILQSILPYVTGAKEIFICNTRSPRRVATAFTSTPM